MSDATLDSALSRKTCSPFCLSLHHFLGHIPQLLSHTHASAHMVFYAYAGRLLFAISFTHALGSMLPCRHWKEYITTIEPRFFFPFYGYHSIFCFLISHRQPRQRVQCGCWAGPKKFYARFLAESLLNWTYFFLVLTLSINYYYNLLYCNTGWNWL